MSFLIEYIHKPFYQLILFIVITILLLIVARPKNTDAAYTIAGIIYAVFIIMNCIMVCFAPKWLPYFFYSMVFSITYILLAYMVILGYTNLLKIKGSEETGMIFLMIIYHPFALLLMMVFKWAYLKLF